ncbi:hypothetical protein Rumeso_04313 [Rubellimicrobium mesophilum DSM 19309]|uniref:Uncharacterized protein n=1 Tax=Rubellimicrobium mesophilum DSM 19309 TaxID=442562 RepID=A0A017HK26_9RHOB|nr:hypothetical protein [Rubellimicrobium mesophilum]EYD74114.1 hypothetical protein Rumeso_04313 [Rubellimicrobium mesophilum DSM 19309]
MKRIVALSLGLALLAGGPLHAERAFDLVFRSGTLDGLPEGTELRYDAAGLSDAQDQDAWRAVVLDLGPENSARLSGQPAEEAGAARPIGSFDSRIGNPVAMMFLEQTVNGVSAATGGSPFYIRNRIRDALGGPGEVEAVTATWQGTAVPATEVALRPFAQDAHRAELGGFADLEIRVVVSEAVPGWYLSMSAEAPAVAAAEPYGISLSLAGVEP